MNNKKYKFKKHKTNICPVPLFNMVMYRTIDIDGEISHVHLPIMAQLINWNQEDLFIGRIYEYRVVP